MKHSSTQKIIGFDFCSAVAADAVWSRFNNLIFIFLLLASVTACNKEEFYEKEFLDNPFSDDTEVTGGSNGGDTSGVDGSTQGGVDAGETGGTDGGTTGGSSAGETTGGTDGGTDGSETTGGTEGGGTDGGTTGSETTGGTDGGVTGGTEGGSDGGTTGGVVYEDVTEKFMQADDETKKLDIMWVIDNSGSMADEQKALGDNFSKFITKFINMDVDFKMGITTTDTSSSSKKGVMVSGSDTKLTSAAAAANPGLFMDDFKSLVKVGTKGSGAEKGLEATEGFMNRYATGANPFVRKDAYLAVVILSDEEDQSSKSVETYTNYLKSFKEHEGLVKIYSIVNTKNVNTGGNTIGHIRYRRASEQTAGVTSNIMDDFSEILLDMGETIANLLDSFALANEPVVGTLRVFVNGAETTGYTYDSASRSIKFAAGNLPPVGAQVTVSYKIVK